MNKSVKILALSSETKEIGKDSLSSKINWRWSFSIDSVVYCLSVTFSKITGKLKIYVNNTLTYSEIKNESFRYGIYLLNILLIFDFHIDNCHLMIENREFDFYLQNFKHDYRENPGKFFENASNYSNIIQENSKYLKLFQVGENLISPIHTTMINNPFGDFNNLDINMDNTLNSNTENNILNDTTQLSDNFVECASPFHFKLEN